MRINDNMAAARGARGVWSLPRCVHCSTRDVVDAPDVKERWGGGERGNGAMRVRVTIDHQGAHVIKNTKGQLQVPGMDL
jgi:hypothetical protein